MNRVELQRLGVSGDEPLSSKLALMKTRDKFIEIYQDTPTQLRVSPKAYDDLRMFAERWEYPFGFDVKVDYDMQDGAWQVCREVENHYAI